MELEELPEEMQEEIIALKHGSNTIECDVTDALEQAENISDFKETVRTRMKDLIGEAHGIITDFCGGAENPDVVLSKIEGVLVDAGYKNMGYAQSMPGSNEVIQKFLKERKILIEIISNAEPNKDVLEGLLDEEETEGDE